MRSLLAALCAIAFAGDASAQRVVHYQTRSGAGPIIGMSLVDARCQPLANVPVFISARPKHGRVVSWRGTDVQRDHPNPACNFRPVPALFLRYVSDPGFVGRDSFSVGCRRLPVSDCRPFSAIIDVGP